MESSGTTPETVNYSNDLYFESGVERTYKSANGAKFDIRADRTGLYFITMLGGGTPPKITLEKYTSRVVAEKKLISYLALGDRMQKADYPNSPLDLRRKSKKPNVDTSEG